MDALGADGTSDLSRPAALAALETSILVPFPSPLVRTPLIRVPLCWQ
jgi:hypothetical protein